MLTIIQMILVKNEFWGEANTYYLWFPLIFFQLLFFLIGFGFCSHFIHYICCFVITWVKNFILNIHTNLFKFLFFFSLCFSSFIYIFSVQKNVHITRNDNSYYFFYHLIMHFFFDLQNELGQKLKHWFLFSLAIR